MIGLGDASPSTSHASPSTSKNRMVYASWDELGHQKIPEMSELEADKYPVKI